MFELWGLFCSVLWLIRSGPPKRKKMLFLGAQGKHHFFQISTYINIKIYRIEIDITLHYTTLINVIYILYIYVLYPYMFCLFHPFFLFPAPSCPGEKPHRSCRRSAVPVPQGSSRRRRRSRLGDLRSPSPVAKVTWVLRISFVGWVQKTSKKHGFSKEIPLPPKKWSNNF